ncbi:MAG: hypothetical protein ACFFHD_07535, partial [Promethearchaeota archaeon]
MIIWILDSESGNKLLYKSFLKTKADEDIVSGFLTAFHHFSMSEFNQSLDSIEMGGLRWIYILEQNYNLLFVAAATKNVKTGLLKGRLNVIKNSFIKEYESVWKRKRNSWDGDINVFLPFIHEIEDYYKQWEEVESITQVADFFDILGIFERIFIMLRNIIENKMYNKSKNLIIDRIEQLYNEFRNRKDFCDEPELENISFSKASWFNFIELNLIKCDKELVLTILKELLNLVIDVLREVKGDYLCLKYFREENIYA